MDRTSENLDVVRCALAGRGPNWGAQVAQVSSLRGMRHDSSQQLGKGTAVADGARSR